MTDVLSSFGVDIENMRDQTGGIKLVPGRVAHIDADFMAYIVAADTRAEIDGIKAMRSLEYKRRQINDFAEYIARRAGAPEYVLHITPTGSDKGGRREQAIQQEYQATRSGREAPEHLDAIRSYIGTECRSAVHLHQEADDGMAQAAYTDRRNAIICSADKDLRMVPGLHLDMSTGEIVNVDDGFGKLAIDDSKSSKKLVGYGPAFFFAQCIMGDTADNIRGLPKADARAVMRVRPTQAFNKDLEKLSAASTEQARQAAEERVNRHLGEPKACGPVLTELLLRDVQTVRDAFELVKRLYTDLAAYHDYVYTHWKTGEAVSPTRALFSEMQLLWMRRTNNPNDVLDWLKENTR